MSSPRPPLLSRIAECHPGWLHDLKRVNTPQRGFADRWCFRLPSPDRRPDLELEVEENEALVAVGRHEQLFVWAPADAEPATQEVVSYVERITRSGNGTDSLHPDVTLLTEELTELLGRVDELLHHRGALSDLRVAGPSQEAHAELALLLPPEHSLDVHIFVGVDGFEIHVNDTVLRLNRIDFGHESPVWIEACIFTLKALLEHDLVIRLRRTLELRRTGAIWIPDREGGCLEW